MSLKEQPPLFAECSASSGFVNAERKQSLVGKRVVLVEDEILTATQLRNTLEAAGLVVVGATRFGMECVRMVQSLKPDLVLLAVNLPDANGLQVAQQVLAVSSPCIVMLCREDERLTSDILLKPGTAGFLHKPIEPSLLLSQLEHAYREFLATQQPEFAGSAENDTTS